MKKITKLQKSIFEAHLNAAKSKFAGIEVVPATDALPEQLREGKICKDLWKWYWTRYVSITSQFMAGPMFDYMSTTAINEMRKRFKIFLTRHNIN